MCTKFDKAFWFGLFFGICFWANAQQFKALLVNKTNGYVHESIEAGTLAILKLGERHFFKVDVQPTDSLLTTALLRKYDVIILLNTTLDIFNEDEQKAFELFIQSGKGYVGVHAASDTEYNWDWYTQLVGRMFIIHPEKQTALLHITNHTFPGLEHFPDTLLWTDEWYEFGEATITGLHTLITVDEATYHPETVWKNADTDKNGKPMDRIGKGMGAFHPIAWYHEFDGGRSFYTALGHMSAIYENQWFLDHLYGGIYYAATGNIPSAK